MKKFFLLGIALLALTASLSFGLAAQAAAPTLSLTSGDGDDVKIDVTGNASASVIMYYQKSDGITRSQFLGTTNTSGTLGITVSTANYGIAPESSIHVTVGGVASAYVAWPYNSNTSTGAISFNQTGLVITKGQSTTLNVNNVGNNLLYMLNNSNPQIANVSISNNQVTLTANTYGQTVVTVCALGTTSNCTSAYVTVQNVGAQSLTFSQTSLTIAYGQSTTVSILSGAGNYTILNNSNPSIISASLDNTTITLKANNSSGRTSLTVCTTNMSACGIINASAGSVTSSSLVFSQTSPSLTVGQSLNIPISGGSNYSISSNSSSNVVLASISGSNSLSLVGNSTGSSVVTVCASNGNCGSVTVTVSYATSGPISLSQNNLWLQAGQAVSVTVSGGTYPYSLADNTGSNIFQANLNNNILTLTGVGAGNGTVNVCSAAGACTQLSVLVNGVSTNSQLTFSNNNISLNIGGTTDVSLFGTGGYYISSTNNQNVASFALNNNKVTVTALSAGSANATVCQSSGQCGVIYATVAGTNTTATPPVLDPANPTLGVGQSRVVNISGGSTSNYSISSNSNPTIAQANINNASLILVGKNAGSTVIVVCAATNNCSSLAVTVNNQSTTNSNNSSGSNTSSGSGTTDSTLQQISREAQNLGGGDITAVLSSLGLTRNQNSENANLNKYVAPLIKGLTMTTAQVNGLNYFITYGTPGTLKLGAGERAGVLSSYWQAFAKLPSNASEWSDAIKIALGRWPGETSAKAETQAKSEFLKVYNRAANMQNAHDANAITIIAYGLRPTSRNTNSEKQAIKSFRAVYRHDPINPLAWNIVRAIAYSGASR
ncbi:MAG: hypothetical protein WC453_02305 [Patescibacteria group bacterium]